MTRRLGIFLLLVWLPPGSSQGFQAEPSPLELFEQRVRPTLTHRCYRCHSAQAEKLKGGLRLDSREAAMKGGDTGPALVPGHPEKSLLIEAISYLNVDLQMPPKGKLTAQEIADLTGWVRAGAPWPKEAPIASGAPKSFSVTERKKEHWAWKPLRPEKPPPVKNTAWVKTPVDAFILARLEARGLCPAPPADRGTLLRRLSFDLRGLPPSPEEAEASGDAESPEAALERHVDRWLESPAFGETWARHWLDLVRYAETRGHEYDYPAPNAWQYRDYVIRALNLDLPYPDFVREHLAGDLLPSPRFNPEQGFNESVLGTGWWYLGEWLHSPVDLRGDQMDRVSNQLEVFGKAFLGLTLNCARCHDHKFDAISQRDFYALAGFLKSSSYRQVRFDTVEVERRVARELRELQEAYRKPIEEALQAAWRPVLGRLAELLLFLARAEAAPSGPPEIEEGLRAAWAKHLRTASPEDPFYAFGLASRGQDLASFLSGEEKRAQAAKSALTSAEEIVDYGALPEAQWAQDGFAFARRAPEDVVPGPDPARPLLRVFEAGQAWADPVFAGLKTAPSFEADPSRVNWVQSGRTLHTPSFVLRRRSVYALVRGAGHAFAEVDGHRMLQGPLHHATTVTWKDEARHWMSLALGEYRSPDPKRPAHLLHLEFTPESPDFAVYRVVQADEPPGDPLDRPVPRLVEALRRNSTIESLAQGYQKLFQAATKECEELWPLRHWMARHPELFFGSGAVPAPARELAEKRAKLAREVARESRTALSIMDQSPADELVLIRGSAATPGDPVPRRFLEALGASRGTVYGGSSGRLELAQELTDPSVTPLLPRVLVNRVWHHLFGHGLVQSVDDFGKMGQAPTHPELLDYLATRFVAQGGSLKKLIRLIVLSNTYALSGARNADATQADPANQLWHHRPSRRLSAEAIRDSMLAVSGQLNPKMYGPPVPIHLDGFQEGRGKPKDGAIDGEGRRSLYLSVRRNFLSSMLQAFDFPQPFTCMGRRSVSNVPAQSLILRNNPFVHEEAKRWALRALRTPGSATGRLREMFLAAYARPPLPEETLEAIRYLELSARSMSKSPEDPEVWEGLAHALFQAKEFIFVP
jgi:hypothetical protein